VTDVIDRANANSGSVPHPSKALLARGFLITILASWLVAPLGVLVLHFWGLGDDAYVVATLLALSVSVPFQLLLNEFLSVADARGLIRVPKVQLACIAGMVLVSSLGSLSVTKTTEWSLPLFPHIVTIAALVAVNAVLSYYSAYYYYRLAISSKINNIVSIANGSIVGLCTLIIFLTAAFTRSSYIAIAILIIPGILHVTFFNFKFKESKIDPYKKGQIATVSLYILLGAASVFFVSTYLASFFRVQFIGWFPQYAAVLLVATNVIGTAAFTLSRIRFLSEGREGAPRSIIGALALAAVAGGAYCLRSPLYPLPAIVSIHLTNVAFIEILRRWGYRRTK
jgi:hypothetical protein